MCCADPTWASSAKALGHAHICERIRGCCLEMGRVVPHGSLPPCGGGTGRGVATNTEREVAKVIEIIEPFAATLARTGRTPSNRREILRTIGQALLAHHRMSGRVEIEEKPDILWDHPELDRLYARLADEYELKERAIGLARKLSVINETARALSDIIDTERSVRLEMIIVALIVVEILVTLYDLFVRTAK